MLTLSFAIDQSSYYWSVNSVSGLCPLQMAPFWSSFIFHALTACDEGNNCRSVWKSRVDYRMRLEISFKRRKKITADKSTNSVRKNVQMMERNLCPHEIGSWEWEKDYPFLIETPEARQKMILVIFFVRQWCITVEPKGSISSIYFSSISAVHSLLHPERLFERFRSK